MTDPVAASAAPVPAAAGEAPPTLAEASAPTPIGDDAAGPLAAATATRPAAVLKGGPRGLEFLVWGRASNDAIATALCTRLAEAPAFFRGNTVRVRVEDGPLPPGCLSRLDDIATRFELRIAEIGAAREPGAARASRAEGDAPVLAVGSAAILAPTATADTAPVTVAEIVATSAASPPPAATEAAAAALAEPGPPAPAPSSAVAPTSAAAVAPAEPAPSAEALAEAAAQLGQLPGGETRIVVGPVRSGVILDHPGNLVVVGDVNPGAEVRAERNIIVLGRLRGIAHAGIGRSYGFILALKLEPQQLRIARQVARAGDADGPVAAAEIAYVTSNKIVVERYSGKLPLGLGNSV